MSDQYEHNIGDHEDPLPGPTWLISFVGVALLAVIVLGLVGVYYAALSDEDVRKNQTIEPIDLALIEGAQQERLAALPHWEVTKLDDRVVDRRLVVPIDSAIDQFIKEQSRR